jgi:hypothetical protein
MTVLRRPAISGDVVEWRRGVLREAGFDAPLARELAGEARVDLHDLLNLVDRGCPPPVAARILAPLDDPSAQAPGS